MKMENPALLASERGNNANARKSIVSYVQCFYEAHKTLDLDRFI